MKLRVKDVLKEFYSILVDLYDSYAFMGLDLAVEDPTAQSAHTIGFISFEKTAIDWHWHFYTDTNTDTNIELYQLALL